MTDLDRFKKLYDDVGVTYKVIQNAIEDGDKYTAIKIAEHYCDKTGGYSWFFTEILFDESGKFYKQNFWE